VGAGDKPTPQGIRVADENGKEMPLRRYDRKTIVLTLPGDLTIFDIGHFGIWCEAFTVDFGHVSVPSVLSVPPSLKMLGVLPQVSTRFIIIICYCIIHVNSVFGKHSCGVVLHRDEFNLDANVYMKYACKYIMLYYSALLIVFFNKVSLTDFSIFRPNMEIFRIYYLAVYYKKMIILTTIIN